MHMSAGGTLPRIWLVTASRSASLMAAFSAGITVHSSKRRWGR